MSDQPDVPEQEPEGDDAPAQQPPADADSRSVLDSIRAVHGGDAHVSVELEEADGAVVEPLPDTPAGARTPRYSVASEIARGGMGAIFKVRDQDLRRNLAMKVLLGGGGALGGPVKPEHLNRFLEEAQVTAQLAHPGVVPVHELGIDADGRVFFTMSLVRGKTLSEIVKLARNYEDGWTMTRAVQVILRVCETMAFAHDKNVIHRDIKPDNVMVGRFGETYVMDWGLAKVAGQEDLHDIRLEDLTPSMPSLVESKRSESQGQDHSSPIMTMDGAVVGTPAYMPPEQARGQVQDVDMRSDVYAIGALLYELLTGQPPYVQPGTQMSPYVVLAAVAMGPPKPIAEIDPKAREELVAVCEKAMAREQGERYATAAELAEDLHRFLSGHVVRAHRTGAVIELKKWVARNKGVAATAAAALVVVAGVTGYFLDSLATEKRNVSDQRDRAVLAEADAKERAAEAEHERDASRALGLAAASFEARGSDSMRSLLLARAAVRTRETSATVEFLRLALAQPVESVFFRGHESWVHSAAFSPDGLRILTASRDKTARIWDTEGRELSVLRGHEDTVYSAAFSPDGSRILTASEDKTARLWDAEGRELTVLRGHKDAVRSAVFSPDGSRILTASRDKTARIWDTEGRELSVLRGHEDTVYSAAFSPDGSRILTASEDKTARLWDAEGRELTVLRGHEGEVYSAAFSPDGSRILTASEDKTARLWDAEGRELTVLRGHEGVVYSATFSPDGSRILTGAWEKTARLWDAEGRELAVLRGHESSVYSAVFSPDGSRILTASPDKTARLWYAEGREPVVIRGHDGPVSSVALSPDGARFLTASADGTARLWDAEQRELTVLRGHEGEVYSAEFSPDGSRILTASADKTARLWDPQGREVAVLRGHEERVYSAVFSPDGSRILTASRDKTARLWDGEGHEVAVLRGHVGGVRSAAFSPDGSRILTAAQATRLWDAEGHELAVTPSGHEKWITSALFSPDGSRILTASGDWTARLWDVEGHELAVLRGHEGWVKVTCGAFSADGSRILTASTDGTARLWDVEGRELGVLRGHEGAVTFAAFSPDGSRILTASWDPFVASWDGTARVWLAHTKDLLALSDERCIRDFTPEERERYADLLGDDDER